MSDAEKFASVSLVELIEILNHILVIGCMQSD